MTGRFRYGKVRQPRMVRPGFRPRRFPQAALFSIGIGVLLIVAGLVAAGPEGFVMPSGVAQAQMSPARAVSVLAAVVGGRASDVMAPAPPPADTLLRSFVSVSGGGGPATAARRGIVTYTVGSGDTLFGIAGEYDISPESVLWSNYTTLRDNPDLLGIGQELVIPPREGVIVTIETGDSVASIARRFKISETALLSEPLNQLRSASQALTPGDLLFAPGGQRETIVWQLPKLVEVSTNAAGVKVYRVGVCGEVAIPRLGTGTFGYPASSRYLSGYNFSNLHPGLDFAGRLGDPIYAADAGTVIYAGYSVNAAGVPIGYGQYVVIDHGNGFQTLYAHASQLFVRCGQQVARGAQIAAVGSVGKSTGPHLHFELRLGGTALNPWTRLPPP